MVYNNTLTATKKDKFFKIIMKRDGDSCFYCTKLGNEYPNFLDRHAQYKREFDHLNKNEQDNRPENLVFAHAMCNHKRRDGHAEMDAIARLKLEENVRNADPSSLGERVGERKKPKHTSELKEPDVNLIVNKLVKAELQTKIPEGSTNQISYSKTLKGLHFLTIEQTGGRGSEQAVRRSLDAYCSEYSDWEDFTDGTGTRLIRRRQK